MERIKDMLMRHVDDLPVLPRVVVRLMALDPKEPKYFERVVSLIEAEPALAARVLALANSAASAPRTPIPTLLAAVPRVGSATASNLVLALSVTRVFVPRDDWEKSLWRHAMQVGLLARALALRFSDPDLHADVAYTCGLLHDLGRFIMFQDAPEALRQIDEGDWDAPEALVAAERSICGLTHTELGAHVCANWRLPPTVIGVIRDHHLAPQKLPPGGGGKLLSIVRWSDLAMFPSAMPGTPGNEHANDDTLKTLLEKGPAFLHLTPQSLRSMLKTVAGDAEAMCVALGLG